MARSDLLVSLVKAAAAQDVEAVRAAANAIAVEARAARHHLLASRLEDALDVTSLMRPAPRPDGRNLPDALVEVTPLLDLDGLRLPGTTRSRVLALVAEQRQAARLREHGLHPRNRILVFGPPGNGKSSLAGALAKTLGCPLLMVNHGALVGSQLGETNRRLDAIFRSVADRRAVLFIDEFDALGKERDDKQETGEMKRVVASLILNIDALPSHVVVVVATNHPGLLDRAIWRRFQLKLELPNPDRAALEGFIASRLGLQAGDRSVAVAVSALAGASYAEAEDFVQDVARRAVLGQDPPLANARALALELADRAADLPTWMDDDLRPDEATPAPEPATNGRPARRKRKEDTRSEDLRAR